MLLQTRRSPYTSYLLDRFRRTVVLLAAVNLCIAARYDQGITSYDRFSGLLHGYPVNWLDLHPLLNRGVFSLYLDIVDAGEAEAAHRILDTYPQHHLRVLLCQPDEP